MKHLLFILILFCSFRCHNDNCHYFLTIKNNCDKDIYYYFNSCYPDTLLYYSNPLSAGNFFSIKSHSKKADSHHSCIEGYFNNTNKLMYFIFDAQVLDTVPWDTVVKNYMILKRYDLSLEDLQQMNWTINYP